MTSTKNITNIVPLLIVGSICTFFVSFAALTYARPDVPVVQTNREVSKESLEQHSEELVFFSSQKFLEVNQSEISFPYSFTDEIEIIWVGYEPENQEERFEVLVSHPQLQNLSWDVIEENGVSLFQREKNFDSIEEFLAAVPDESEVRIDSKLKPRFPDLSNNDITDFEFELEGVNYILTTYTHDRYVNGVYYFESIIDATQASSESADLINWYVRAPNLEEGESYLLGNINVNYIQY